MTERRLRLVLAERKCRFPLVGQSAEHRLNIARVELVQLLNVFDDIRHLRRVNGDLFIGDLEVRKFCY